MPPFSLGYKCLLKLTFNYKIFVLKSIIEIMYLINTQERLLKVFFGKE